MAPNPVSDSWRGGRYWSTLVETSSNTHGAFSYSFKVGDVCSRSAAGNTVSKSWTGSRICSHKYRPYAWFGGGESDWMELELLRRDR